MGNKKPAKSGAKQKDTKFKKGQSGNPAGRPQGSRNKVSILLDGMLQEQAEALLQKAINEALSGDSQTLRALIDKLLPNRKDSPVKIRLPKRKDIEGLVKITETILSSVGNGKLTPSEAAALTKIVDAHRSSLEVTELDARLSKLEKTIKG